MDDNKIVFLGIYITSAREPGEALFFAPESIIIKTFNDTDQFIFWLFQYFFIGG